jgi:DNA-binding XRE family transcriptional regulator
MEQKINEQQQAQNLYFQTELSQAEIANIVGVSSRTICRWINKENWKRMKEATRCAPIAIVEKLYFQLNEINDYILSREPGRRFASKDEADIIRKLTMSIDKLKQQVGLNESIQIMMGFTTYVSKRDLDLAKKITLEANSYIKGSPAELRKPYEMFYNTDDTEPMDEEEIYNSVTVSGPERQPKDELRHGHRIDNNTPMTDNVRQSSTTPQTTTQPLPVKDNTVNKVTQNQPSLSNKKIPGTQDKPHSRLSKEEIEDIVAKAKADERRMREYRRTHL